MSDRDQKVKEKALALAAEWDEAFELAYWNETSAFQDVVMPVASRLIDLEAKASECEAEHPPEPEYTTWCEAGKPDGQRIRDLESALIESKKAHALLAQAVNDNDGGCGEGCNSYGHADDCKLDMATSLSIQQGKINELRPALIEASGAASKLCMWVRHTVPQWTPEVEKYLEATESALATLSRLLKEETK